MHTLFHPHMSSTTEEGKALIAKHGLQPHPEGGHYARTYTASATVQTARGPRPASTAILFLLHDGQVSHLHRLQSDEMWHIYQGALDVVMLKEDGEYLKPEVVRLDQTRPQYNVPAGIWFGSRAVEGQISFVGCTVTPGFVLEDFELADASLLERVEPGSVEELAPLIPVAAK